MEKQDCLSGFDKSQSILPCAADALSADVLINSIVPAMSSLSLSSGECKGPSQKKENKHCDSCVQHKRLPKGDRYYANYSIVL